MRDASYAACDCNNTIFYTLSLQTNPQMCAIYNGMAPLAVSLTLQAPDA